MTEFKAGDRVKVTKTTDRVLTAGMVGTLLHTDNDGDWWARFEHGKWCLEKDYTEYKLAEKENLPAVIFAESLEKHLETAGYKLKDGLYELGLDELASFIAPMFEKAGYSISSDLGDINTVRVRKKND